MFPELTTQNSRLKALTAAGGQTGANILVCPVEPLLDVLKCFSRMGGPHKFGQVSTSSRKAAAHACAPTRDIFTPIAPGRRRIGVLQWSRLANRAGVLEVPIFRQIV